jgi:hypothetical protein
MCVMIAATGSPIEQLSLDDAPGFDDFHRGLISGEISLTTPAEKIDYARVHLARFHQNANP